MIRVFQTVLLSRGSLVGSLRVPELIISDGQITNQIAVPNYSTERCKSLCQITNQITSLKM